MFKPKSILVPTDFSENAKKALDTAIDIASKYGSKIHLLHVMNIVQQCSADYCMNAELVSQVRRESKAATKSNLNRMIKKTAGGKSVKIISEVREGIPYDEILREQAKDKMDLIVIGAHSRKGIFSHFMGGVANKVSSGAKCPVIVVK